MNPPLDRLQEIVTELAPVVQSFATEGDELYLVGGVVRDVLLGIELSTDIDLTTNARPDVIKRRLAPISKALWDQGERFGTIGAKVGDYEIEITTFRSESYDSDSRKPEVEFGDSLEGDLVRRDFTINAMAYSCHLHELIDPFDGAKDLSSRLLRTPTDPSISFSDDPLRILRAARFASRLNLSFDEALTRAAAAQVDRFSVVSAERVSVELEKLLATDHLGVGFDFLAGVGLVEVLFPWLAEANSRSRFINEAEQLPRIEQRRALLFENANNARQQLQELKYSNGTIASVQNTHSAFDLLSGSQALEADIRRLVARSGKAAVVDAASILNLRGRAAALTSFTRLKQTGELDRLDPPISGDQVMAKYGISQGPEVGEALSYIKERIYEAGPIEVEEAWRLLDERR